MPLYFERHFCFVNIIPQTEKRKKNMPTSIVKGAPGHYRIGEGILGELPQFIAELQIKNLHIISGRKSWQATKPYLPEEITRLEESNLTFVEGHTTLEKVNQLANKIKSNGIDAVLGIGGGTALDITKATAVQADIKSILIPSIAATCAAWTPLSVFYDRNGAFTHYTEFPLATTLVLVEPAIIAEAPVQYLKAGIGDTLAKFYEADALIEAFFTEEELPVPVKVSQFSAIICRDVLLKDGQSALDSVNKGIVTNELTRVIEAIFMTGGMVGGFGEKAGRIAGAHSIHNGLTEAKEVKSLLHGELVAYGILVQLALEDKQEELIKLLDYYQKWALPTSLSQLNIVNEKKELLSAIIEKAILPHESIHFMKREITKEAVFDAMMMVEKLNLTKAS